MRFISDLRDAFSRSYSNHFCLLNQVRKTTDILLLLASWALNRVLVFRIMIFHNTTGRSVPIISTSVSQHVCLLLDLSLLSHSLNFNCFLTSFTALKFEHISGSPGFGLAWPRPEAEDHSEPLRVLWCLSHRPYPPKHPLLPHLSYHPATQSSSQVLQCLVWRDRDQKPLVGGDLLKSFLLLLQQGHRLLQQPREVAQSGLLLLPLGPDHRTPGDNGLVLFRLRWLNAFSGCCCCFYVLRDCDYCASPGSNWDKERLLLLYSRETYCLV